MLLEPPSQTAPPPGTFAHGEFEDANSGSREFAQDIVEQDFPSAHRPRQAATLCLPAK